MAFTVELEEWVGSVWHRFITRRASPDFPEARVELASLQRPLALLFRAMGGASGIALEAASPRQLLLRRNLLQQVAGTCKQLPVAWCDSSNLRLPPSSRWLSATLCSMAPRRPSLPPRLRRPPPSLLQRRQSLPPRHPPRPLSWKSRPNPSR